MLSVIGGTYRECCVSPSWDQLYGSGLRAAVACAELARVNKEAPELHTWASPGEVDELCSRAEAFGFPVQIYDRKGAIEFRYEHPLARPEVFPPPQEISTGDSEAIGCKNALLFGVLESRVAVTADRIVYDPQAGPMATPFSQTGSRASQVCIVANFTEARHMIVQLTGEHISPSLTATNVAPLLLTAEKVHAVIVKDGIHGAVVATSDTIEVVPCYKTEEVFSIGSGDVFSAIFAHFWLNEGKDAVDAAGLASRATAYYCNTRYLPIPADLLSATCDLEPIRVPHANQKTAKVYLASPLFNVPERWFVEETKRCLQSLGLEVFSPFHEVGYSGDACQLASDDLQGLDDSDLVFALVDCLDAGTIFEIGYATAKGKPVVAYGERVSESDMTLLVGTGAQVFHDYATAIYHAAWVAVSL